MKGNIMDALVQIGEAAQWVGLPKKTIRYYEDIGLVSPLRTENGFRQFRQGDILSLTVIKNARHLGFSLEDSRVLLDLFKRQDRRSSEVNNLAIEQLEKTREKIAQLSRLKEQLEHLVSQCPDDDEPDCTILEFLADSH